MFIEIVKINNDSSTHHSVLIKQQSKQKLPNAIGQGRMCSFYHV